MNYVLFINPIKIDTLYTSQNDQGNLSFVKDINVIGDKMTRNGRKMTISKSCTFLTEQTLSHQKVPKSNSQN